MDVITKEVRGLVKKELAAANRRFRMFASAHEGQNVIREELDEVEMALEPLKFFVEIRMWNTVKGNKEVAKEELKEMMENAIHLAVEAIQLAAMLKKYECSQRNSWPGSKEMGYEKEE